MLQVDPNDAYHRELLSEVHKDKSHIFYTQGDLNRAIQKLIQSLAIIPKYISILKAQDIDKRMADLVMIFFEYIDCAIKSPFSIK